MSDYKPKFFNEDDFEGIAKIIETMIDTNGNDAVSPLVAAQRVDSYLSQIESPALASLRLAINAIDSWYLPLLLDFKFGRFSKLSLAQRRRVITKIIYPKGLFKIVAAVRAGARDAARTLKLLSCVGYYGSPEGMCQVGYTRVNDRARLKGVSQDPFEYEDPFNN